MGKCLVCEKEDKCISDFLKVCSSCAKEGSEKAMKLIDEAHYKSGEKFKQKFNQCRRRRHLPTVDDMG